MHRHTHAFNQENKILFFYIKWGTIYNNWLSPTAVLFVRPSVTFFEWILVVRNIRSNVDEDIKLSIMSNVWFYWSLEAGVQKVCASIRVFLCGKWVDVTSGIQSQIG